MTAPGEHERDDTSRIINACAVTRIHEKENLLQAEKIHLRVLAPAKYYEKYNLSWLEKNINDGLADFLAQRKFEIDFEFETLTLVSSRSPATWKV